jgi:hypothetical protein
MEYPASILELEPEQVVKRRGRPKGYQVTQATKDKAAATRKNKKNGNQGQEEQEDTPRKKRCPNGTRRNKRNGECEDIIMQPVPQNIEGMPFVLPPSLPQIQLSRKRCPNGTRKNKRTGICEKININRERCPNGTRKNKFTGFCEPVNVDTNDTNDTNNKNPVIRPEPELDDENEVANIQPDGSFQEASLPSEVPSPLQTQEPSPLESEPAEPEPESDASSKKLSTPEPDSQSAKSKDEDDCILSQGIQTSMKLLQTNESFTRFVMIKWTSLRWKSTRTAYVLKRTYLSLHRISCLQETFFPHSHHTRAFYYTTV